MDARLLERLGAGVGGSGILGFLGPGIGFAASGLVAIGATGLMSTGGYPRERLRSGLIDTAVGGLTTGGVTVGAGATAGAGTDAFLDRLLSDAMGRGV